MSNFEAIVECPKCGYKQKTTTVRRVRCHECLSDYTVMPMGKGLSRTGKSRIVKVVKGSAFNEYWKEKNRKYFHKKKRGKRGI